MWHSGKHSILRLVLQDLNIFILAQIQALFKQMNTIFSPFFFAVIYHWHLSLTFNTMFAFR